MTGAASLVEVAVLGRVLVFGSLPGAGSDLDLLVRDDDLEAPRRTLARAGFQNRGDEWVRFADGSADAVDLVPASTWKLPADELDRLFEQASPIEGCTKVVRPAPHHALLILARLTGVPVESRVLGRGDRRHVGLELDTPSTP